MSRRSTVLATAALAAATALAWRRRRSDGADGPGVLGPEAVRRLYDRLAPAYDALKGAYGLGGDTHLRAVEALGLRPGDTAVDLACGTGANLPHLVRAVGPAGRVVGVDLSPGMLAKARERLEAQGWDTVELVQADVRTFDFPEPLHGVVSTFGLEMVPEHDAVVSRAVAALAPGCRITVGGLRRPERWPEWAIRLGELAGRPFGVAEAYEAIQPWRAVEARTTANRVEERLFGAFYLAVGTKPTGQPDTP